MHLLALPLTQAPNLALANVQDNLLPTDPPGCGCKTLIFQSPARNQEYMQISLLGASSDPINRLIYLELNSCDMLS
jgi:hypothetical protein